MAVESGKIAEVVFEEALEAIDDQMMLIDTNKVDRFQPNSATMQNANNIIWRPVEQQAPIISGWSVGGQEQNIIEETYPALLEDPNNDYVEVRVDDLRDMEFWRRRGRRSGRQQAVELNKQLAQRIALQGSLFYRFDTSSSTSGFDFISEAQATLNEQQRSVSNRCFLLNDRDTRTFAQDLAGRQTVQGRPEMTWDKGQIGQNVAEFDVYTGSFLPILTGGADPATTVTAESKFVPEGGSVDTSTGVVTNVDYRIATIPVTSSASYNVGDKVTFTNGSDPVYAVGASDKTNTLVERTFTIVAIPSGTSVSIYPKPIALNDGDLTLTQQAYANVDTYIDNGAVMNRVNIDDSARTNIFWDKEAVEVISGTIPADLFKSWDGKRTIQETMANGQEMYMIYDSDIQDMNFRYRLFTWWGITIRDPSRCGVAVTF